MTTATKPSKFERAMERLRNGMEVKANQLALKRFKIGLGEGNVSDGELCVMQMAYILAMSRKGKTVDDMPTDHPPCVANPIIRFAINYNDGAGDEDREALRPIIPAMLNTKGDGKSKQRDKLLRRTLTEVNARIAKHNAEVEFEDWTPFREYGDPKVSPMGEIAAWLGEWFAAYDPEKGRKVLKALCKGQA